MSTLFVLLGVIFLGGGIASIVDGYPYMVLERGFTQVIVGSVAVATGVLLLALSRVMAELKQVKQTLANAVMAVSVATLAAEQPAAATPGAEAREPDVASTDTAGSGTVMPGAAAGAIVGAGAVVGAAGAVVAGSMMTRDRLRQNPSADGETAPRPDSFEQAMASTSSPGDEADLFAKVDAEIADIAKSDPDMSQPDHRDETFAVAAMSDLEKSEEMAGEPFPVAPASSAPADDISDPFAEALLAPAVEAGAPSDGAFDALNFGEAVEPPNKGEPDFDALLAWPEPYRPVVAAPLSEPRDDAFGSLRDDLAGRPGSRDQAADIPARDEGRRQGGEIEAAESWMDRPVGRSEPWFSEPPAQPASTEADETAPVAEASRLPDLQRLPWPPSKRGSAAIEPATIPRWPTLEGDREPEAAIEVAEHEAFDEPLADEAASSASPGDTVQQPQPEPDESADLAPPAASAEGVVGAYQVGDANFTIYADGSIKARTPDGDYNFGSMDELKTYLASEKSRLGV